jgi:neutral amino acid transport system permease protein
MNQLIQLLINGISVGSIIALASVGLTLTYGILRLSNFAHGDLMTLGAYFTLLADGILFPLVSGLPEPLRGFLLPWVLWVGMAVGALLSIGVVLLGEKAVWEPMRAKRASSTTMMIISIGLALLIRNGIVLLWGGGNQRYNLPVSPALELGGGLTIPANDLLVIGLACAAIAGLHFLLQNTRIGKAMRAVADDIDLARFTGINVSQVVFWTWVIAGGMTALGGSMLGLVEAVRPNMGWFLILPLFASVILGGIGNPYGAIAGAFIIGIVQEVSTYWLPTEYKLGVALLIMVLVLLFKPQGLFRGTM